MLYSISYLHYQIAKALLYRLCHSTNVGGEQIQVPQIQNGIGRNPGNYFIVIPLDRIQFGDCFLMLKKYNEILLTVHVDSTVLFVIVVHGCHLHETSNAVTLCFCSIGNIATENFFPSSGTLSTLAGTCGSLHCCSVCCVIVSAIIYEYITPQ